MSDERMEPFVGRIYTGCAAEPLALYRGEAAPSYRLAQTVYVTPLREDEPKPGETWRTPNGNPCEVLSPPYRVAGYREVVVSVDTGPGLRFVRRAPVSSLTPVPDEPEPWDHEPWCVVRQTPTYTTCTCEPVGDHRPWCVRATEAARADGTWKGQCWCSPSHDPRSGEDRRQGERRTEWAEYSCRNIGGRRARGQRRSGTDRRSP